MKGLKKVLGVSILGLAVLALGACGKGDDKGDATGETKEATKVVIGATAVPHAEILEIIKDDLKDEGVDLEIKLFDDYPLLNIALESGDIDANFFQHTPYLESFNEERGANLVSVGKIHFEPLGIYPGKTASLDALKDGAKVAIPDDATNGARALLLLESAGLIKLKDGADITSTKKDIVENPKNLEIVEIAAVQIPRTVEDVDVAVINANYALEAGFNVGTDALASEGKDSAAAEEYGNIIAVKAEKKDDAAIQAIVKALQKDKVRDFINEKYEGAVVPVF